MASIFAVPKVFEEHVALQYCTFHKLEPLACWRSTILINCLEYFYLEHLIFLKLDINCILHYICDFALPKQSDLANGTHVVK